MCRKFGPEAKQGKAVADGGERKLVIHERDGRLRNLLKKTYLKRWINPLDASGNEVGSDPSNEGKYFHRGSSSMDLARHVLIFIVFVALPLLHQ